MSRRNVKRRIAATACVGLLIMTAAGVASWFDSILHPESHYARKTTASGRVQFFEGSTLVLTVADADEDGYVDYVHDRRMLKSPLRLSGEPLSDSEVSKVIRRSSHTATFDLDQRHSSWVSVPIRYAISLTKGAILRSRPKSIDYW